MAALKRLLFFLPLLIAFFLCGWLIAPPELLQAVASIWFAVIVSLALAIVVALLIGLWWLWTQAKKARIIQPDPNGNFGLMPVRGGYRNLNLVGADTDPWAWGVWEFSTAKTSQPNLEQPSRLPSPRLISSDAEASSLMLEGKAKILDL